MEPIKIEWRPDIFLTIAVSFIAGFSLGYWILQSLLG